ncbi:MAG: cytochrome c-type biogenesis protein CcmH [Acidimicrobiia bacterium]
MNDTMKTLLPIAVGAIALGIIVVGLAGGTGSAPTVDDRVEALAASIKCPFCSGESLADSGSAVAADYRALIAQRIEAGATDDEILDEFAANFGDAYILDTSTSGWQLALWAIPVAALIGGIVAVVGIKRASGRP